MEKVIIIGSGITSLMEMEMIRIATANHPKIEIAVAQQTERPFDREPLQFLPVPKPKPPEIIELYDKKGKPLPLPKSKFHK